MIRFAVIADVQYGNLDTLGERTYRESLPKFLAAAGEIAAENVLRSDEHTSDLQSR